MRKILHLICYACTVLVEQTLWECDSPSLNPWLSYQNHTFYKLLYFFLTILNLHVTDKNSYDTPASAIVHSVFMIKTYRIIFKAFLTQLWKKQISIWKSYKIDIKLERANLIHAPSPPTYGHHWTQRITWKPILNSHWQWWWWMHIHLFYPLGDYFNFHNFLTSTQGSLQSNTMWTAGLKSLNIH